MHAGSDTFITTVPYSILRLSFTTPSLPAFLYSNRNICARLRVTLSMLSVFTDFPALV